MENQKDGKERRPDRRTRYTRNVIKDALLELLHRSSFDQITVSALCRQAEIGRATFYSHYDNLTDVLDELIEDAISLTQRGAADSIEGMRQVSQALMEDVSMRELENKLLLLPVCQRVADNPKYNILFRDAAISDYLLQKLYRQEREHMILQLSRYSLTEQEADMLFLFLLTGSFSVNKSLNWVKDESWIRIQRVLMLFICGGFDALEKL